MAEVQAGEPRRQWRRWLGILFVALVLVLLSAELVARFGYRAHDMPLRIPDPEMRYRFKPSASYRPLGNRVVYNNVSMRNEQDVPPRRAEELRVLVMGDSVVNGGVHVDQALVATTLAQNALVESLGRPVFVGNISAGSWAPPDLLGYVRRFGLFDADVVIVVLSSHDYAAKLDDEPMQAEKRPLLALGTVADRLAQRLQRSARSARPEPTPQEIEHAMGALRRLVERIQAADCALVVFHHSEKQEIDGGYKPGFEMIASVLREQGVELVEMRNRLRDALRRGDEPYSDNIHLTAAGQRVLAEAIVEAVQRWQAGRRPGLKQEAASRDALSVR